MNNIFLFHGEDGYSSHQKAQDWKKIFLEKYGDLNLSLFEGAEITSAMFSEAIETMPFLSEKKLIIIRDIFSDAPIEEQRQIAEKIEKVPEHAVVVFTERNKADSRTSLFKQIKKHGQISEFLQPDRPTLMSWITEEFRKRGKPVTTREAGILADSVGPNLWQLSHEIEKLIVHSGGPSSRGITGGTPITDEDISALTSPNIEVKIFKLTDEISQKRRKDSITTLRHLIDSGEDLVQVMFMIARHIRILLQIRSCLDKKMSPQAITKKLKEHPYAITNGIRQCKNFDSHRLEKMYREILDMAVAMRSSKIKMTTDDQSELRLSLEKFIIRHAA